LCDEDTEYDEVEQMRNMRRSLAALMLLVTSSLPAESGPQDQALLLEEGLSASPENTIIVCDNEGPLALYGDYNRDGLTDVAFLVVAREPGVVASATDLRDPVRIHSEPTPVPLFLLETYLRGDAAIHTITIGRHRMWDSLEQLLIAAAPTPIIGVLGSFREPEGTYRVLVVFDDTGMASRLDINTAVAESSLIGDIDSDGVLDVVTMRRLPEAGRGYETFVELYHLDEPGLVPSDSFPLVRELNMLVEGLEQALKQGNWAAIASYVAPGGDGLSASGEGPRAGNGTTDLSHVFVEYDVATEIRTYTFDLHAADYPISKVVATRFLENPFPDPILGQVTHLQLRVETSDERTRYFEVTVRLERNPFSGRRFAFLTDNLPGQ
jgi:hypothetical protein